MIQKQSKDIGTLGKIDNIDVLYSCRNFSIKKFYKGDIDNLCSEEDIIKIKDFIKKFNIKYFFRESDYHFKFDKIISKPFLLYFLGDSSVLNLKLISIVGPRKPTLYAQKILEKLFIYLRHTKGIATVSGLAPGVDSLVHKLSIENGIPTIAVLGGGLNYYLKYKKNFIEKIVKSGGLILSEFKLFQEPTNYTFPQRNRIIAGLADFVFLPEAGEKSGSLITVDFALKMNVEVYGCPNNIFDPNSLGINKYIAEGKIKAIYDLKKFVEEKIGSSKGEVNLDHSLKLTEKEKDIIRLISKGFNSLSSLQVNSNLDLEDLLTTLSSLEIKGIVKQPSPGFYELI